MCVKNARHSLVHHDDGMPGVEHDEAPLGAGSLGVQGDQQVGCKALIMLYGVHDTQGNLNGHQVVCLRVSVLAPGKAAACKTAQRLSVELD